MRFDGLTLENFTCYEHATIPFHPGVTVIHGVNGSGKSSLLDASFFALYGADTLDGATLDEVLSTGSTELTVLLSFTHAGSSYEIERTVRLRGERAHTTTCELRGPNEPITGARAVQSAVAEMLRMDADAFLNCAYVRQGEVNKLIHASPRERQNMIDELLQLGILEEYRDRAIAARRGIAAAQEELVGQVNAITGQIEEKNRPELIEQQNQTKTEIAKKTESIETIDDRIEQTRTRKESAEAILEQSSERRDELTELNDSIDSLREKIEEHTGERESLTDEITEIVDKKEDLRASIEEHCRDVSIEPTLEALDEEQTRLLEDDDDLRDSIEEARIALQGSQQRLTQAKERVNTHAERIDEARESIDTIQQQLSDESQSLTKRRQQLASLQQEHVEATEAIETADIATEDIDKRLQECNDERAELRDTESQLRTTLQHHKEDIEDTQALIAEGKCPTCEQPIDAAPPVTELDSLRDHVTEIEATLKEIEENKEALDQRVNRLETIRSHAQRAAQLEEQITTLSELVAEKSSNQESRKEEIERLQALIDEEERAEQEARDIVTSAQENIEEHREHIGQLNDEREQLKSKRSTIETMSDLLDRNKALDETLERTRERRDAVDRLLREQRDRLTEKRNRARELRDSVDENRIVEAQETIDNATAFLEEAQNKRENLVTSRENLLETLGSIRSELEDIASLEEHLELLKQRVSALDNVHDDVESLESAYGTLRGDLREQNIVALERLLNDTFTLIYQNDAYDRIDLDREYRFTIYQKDGEPLRPDQLSGGERALFNLSLRCAIYRLLSEAIQGTAPLPPLILDEPTVYLDSGHVGRLVELVDAMRDVGVEQIIIVTHDEELLHTADTLLHVEKDSTTNRSRVESVPALSAGLNAD